MTNSSGIPPDAIGCSMRSSNRCPNCNAPFVPTRRRYCPECGQETQVQPPTLGEFAQQFGGAYFSTEGALWRTLKLLLLKPGELTQRYRAGQRKHFVLPLRLYLTISVVTMLILRLVTSGPDGGLRVEGDIGKGEWSLIRWDNDSKGPMIKDGVFICTGVPDWVCQRLARRFEADPKALKREFTELRERGLSRLGVGMFVMLPLFAAGLKGLYLNRRLRYTEHLVFALHVQSFWFLMWGLMLCNLDVLTTLAVIAVPAYSWLAMKRVYGGRWGPRVLRAALLTGFYAAALASVLLGVAVWSLLA